MSRPHLTLAAAPKEEPFNLLEAFAEESLDGLEQMDEALRILRQHPDNTQLFTTMLRHLHTIRTNAATVQLPHIQRLSQWMEAIADHFSRTHLPPDASQLEMLTQGCSHLKLLCLPLLGRPSSSQSAQKVNAVTSRSPSANGPFGAAGTGNPAPGPGSLPVRNSQLGNSTLDAAQLLLEQRLQRLLTELTQGGDPQSPPIGELLVARGELSRQDLDRVLELQQQPTGALLVALGLSTPEQIASALALQPQGPGRPHLRVESQRLESLQALTSHLLLECARLEVLAPLLSAPGKLTEVRKLARYLWNELQQLRMTSLEPLFERLSDVARQVAEQTGRELDVSVEGGELKVEAEYMIVLNSVLPHAIRNAVAHGIEIPSIRAERGKDVRGRLLLRAWRVDQELHIVISDDGAGLDLETLAHRARELHVPDTSGASGPARYEMLFSDGFTTRTNPADDAGMGVGLAVIREAIQRMGGRVWIDGNQTRGADLHLVLPTRIEALDGLVVRSNQLAYVLPASAVVEFVRPTRTQCRELRGPTPMLMVRGTPIPIVWLEAALGRSPSATPLWERLVVLVSLQPLVQGAATQEGEAVQSWGLVVDELAGPQRLPNLLTAGEHANGLCGQVVLEDGSVAEVLDLTTLMRG